MGPWLQLGVVVALALINGVFAGAEIALLAVRKTRLAELAEEGHRGASAALALRRDPERLLATVQIAITVVSAAGAVFGGAALEAPLVEALGWVGLEEGAHVVSFVIVVATVSYFSLVLGELVPKSLALQRTEVFAIRVAPLLVALAFVLAPLVWLLTRSSNLVLRLFDDETNFSEARLSPDELQQLVEEAGVARTLHEGAAHAASRAIDLGKMRVAHVMVPRARVVTLSRTDTLGHARRVLREQPHARYPVVGKDIDDVVGYVVARQVLARLAAGRDGTVAQLMRPMPVALERALAIDALRELQQKRTPIAMVVDELGQFSGILTARDVADVILGDTPEEHAHPSRPLWRSESGLVHARGDATVHEVSRFMDVDLHVPAGVVSIAGAVIHVHGRIPMAGDVVRVGGLNITVIEATDRAVIHVGIEHTDERRSLPPSEA